MFKNDKIHIIVPALIFLLFVSINIGFVFSQGVCCADDAVYALVAKNLAIGNLNNNNYPYNNWGNLFDPNLGSGPLLIIPTSIMVLLFGNRYWVPGFSNVVIWSSLLILIFLTFKKMLNKEKNIIPAIVIFFGLSFFFFTYHLEQWYALLGEIPAGLLIILSIILFYFDNKSKKILFFTGVCFSLASNIKLLGMISFFVFLSIIIIEFFYKSHIKKVRNYQPLLSKLFYIMMGFMTPFIVIEVWKFFTLGFSGYLNYWKTYLITINTLGKNSNEISIIPLFFERIDILLERFGIYLPAYIPIIVYGRLLIEGEKKLLPIYCNLNLIVFFFSIYWIFFSIGWARYFVIPLILIIFLLVVPLFAKEIKFKRISFYLLLIFIFSIQGFQHISYPFNVINNNLFQETDNVRALKQLGKVLDTNESVEMISQNWPAAVDLEYIMKSNKKFLIIDDPSINFSNQYFFAANSKFLVQPDKRLEEFLLHCDIDKIGQYIYGFCNKK